MKAYQKELQVSVCCQKCGREIPPDVKNKGAGSCTIETDWGYFSNKDGEHHKFHICEECYDEWVKTFQIPVQVTERIQWF